MAHGRKITPLFRGVDDEARILEGLREGREAAFDALFDFYSERVFRLAVNFLGDEDLARNALQDTFLRVFRGIPSFRGESGLGTWIYRIATNVCLNDIARSGRKRTRCVTGSAFEAMADESRAAQVEEAAERGELVERAYELVDRLEPDKRMTFILHYVDGLTVDEIGQILDEGRGTVLKRLQRTRAELVDMAVEAGLAERSPERAREGRS